MSKIIFGMSEDKMIGEIPKATHKDIQPIAIDNSYSFTGEELERLRRTPMPPGSGASGSVLDNLGAKADIKTDPLAVAIQPDLSEDDKRRRIDALYAGFHRRVSSIVGRYANPDENPNTVDHDLDRLMDSRSDIVAGTLTPAREPIRRNGR